MNLGEPKRGLLRDDWYWEEVHGVGKNMSEDLFVSNLGGESWETKREDSLKIKG